MTTENSNTRTPASTESSPESRVKGRFKIRKRRKALILEFKLPVTVYRPSRRKKALAPSV